MNKSALDLLKEYRDLIETVSPKIVMEDYCVSCDKKIPAGSDIDQCKKCYAKEQEKKKKVKEDITDMKYGNNDDYSGIKDVVKKFKIDDNHVLRVSFYDPARGGIKVRFKVSSTGNSGELSIPEFKDFTDPNTARIYAASAWGVDINKPQEVKESWYADSPVYRAVMHRLEYSHADLFTKYGFDVVEAAVDDVASFVGDTEEIGSSDVSIWTKQVIKELERDQAGAGVGNV